MKHPKDQKVVEGNQLELKISCYAGMLEISNSEMDYSRTYLPDGKYYHGMQCGHYADTEEYNKLMSVCEKIADLIEQNHDVFTGKLSALQKR